jgi:hypothetical protein
MEFRAFRGIFGAAGLLAAGGVAAASGMLETPDSDESGISLISGWHCTASVVEIQIDNGPRIRAGSGTLRPDTASVCGHSNTGFGLTYNYNVHPAGIHTVTAYADGMQFAKRSFTTYNFGTEYLQGANGSCLVNDFPVAGRSAILAWTESKQNFSIVSTTAADATSFLRQGESTGSARTSVVATDCSVDMPLEPSEFDEGPARASVSIDNSARTLTVQLFTTGGRHCALTGPLGGHYPYWYATLDMAGSDLSCLGDRRWDRGSLSMDQHISGLATFGNEAMVLIGLRVSGGCARQWLSFHGASVPR